LSEGTTIGTLQLPPDGGPILLMADSAPTGGYRRIAHVIAADLPNAAQLRPGQTVLFSETSLNEAQQLAREQRDDLKRALIMAGLSPAIRTVGRQTLPAVAH
jgi:antagonist of KipI